uniref:cilia- and flagella-associated protein 184 n=1 Tax=Semicossyphus pulcher TaxID=241346 RepID=UPI0037E994D8
MDGERENEAKNGTERAVSADLFNEEISPMTENGNETVPSEIVASNHDEESMKATEEAPVKEAATSEPEENTGNELLDTNQNLDVKISTVNEQPISHEESVVFEIDCNDEDGPHRLHLETPERETTTPQEEEDEAEEEPTPANKEDISYEEYKQFLQELSEQRDKASQHSSQLQVKLVEYLSRGEDEAQVEREESEQLQEYERYMNILSELKQQINMELESAQQQEEALKGQSQEKLNKVEKEWRAFVALKQDVAVSVLSRRFRKQAAQAKVETILAAEQNRQDELIKLRLKHLKLRLKIHRLEAELRDRDEHRDPFQLEFERLQAKRLVLKKKTEKQKEESLKISSLQVLSNVREKLLWSQMDVKAKRQQLAEVEATLARKREVLTRIKKTCSNLQRDNVRLKECRGLLGNKVLLRDLEDTVDACEHLEEKLEKLKGRHAKIVFKRQLK